MCCGSPDLIWHRCVAVAFSALLNSQSKLIWPQIGPAEGMTVQSIKYTMSQKTRHQTLSYNFANYYLIFKFFLLADSLVNLQQIHV